MFLKEETQDFASEMFSSGFFVIHDTATGGQHNVTEIQKWKLVKIDLRLGFMVSIRWKVFCVLMHSVGNFELIHTSNKFQIQTKKWVECLWMKTHPNWRDGKRLFVHFSMSLIGTSNRGEMTPHLLRRPVRFTTTLPERWSSTISNSPMYPCFIITVKNLMMTFEHGRNKTWRLPRFSALLMHFKASAKTFMRTILSKIEKWKRKWISKWNKKIASNEFGLSMSYNVMICDWQFAVVNIQTMALHKWLRCFRNFFNFIAPIHINSVNSIGEWSNLHLILLKNLKTNHTRYTHIGSVNGIGKNTIVLHPIINFSHIFRKNHDKNPKTI